MNILIDNSVWQRLAKPGVLARLASIKSANIVTGPLLGGGNATDTALIRLPIHRPAESRRTVIGWTDDAAHR